MSSGGEPGGRREAVVLVRRAQRHLRRREFVDAERLLLRALVLFGDEDDLDRSVCLNNLGSLYHVLGDDARAEPLLREVVDVRRRLVGASHPATLRSLLDLAEFHRSCDDEAQAAFWQRLADEAGERSA